MQASPHHHHHHDHSPVARLPQVSLLRLSVAQRLAMAMIPIAGLWALVVWALQS